MPGCAYPRASSATRTGRPKGQDLGIIVDGIRLLMIGVSPAACAVFGWWEFMSSIRNVATGLPAIGAFAKYLRDRLPSGIPQEPADADTTK